MDQGGETMRIAELGEIGSQALLYGGPGSNVQAVEQCFAVALARGIAHAAVIGTGDVVGPGGNPAAAVEAVRAFGGPVVAGDCDRAVAAGARDTLWQQQAAAALMPEHVAWLRDLPGMVTFTLEGKRVAVIHGGVTEPGRVVWPSDPDAGFAEEIAAVAARVGPVEMVVAGHSGIPFHRRVGTVDWVNAGTVMRPPHDGRPEVRVVHMTAKRVRFLRLPYDVAGAQGDMTRAGRSEVEIAALASGYWADARGLPEALSGGVVLAD